MGFDGLVRDLCSEKCLNLSDRGFSWRERKVQAWDGPLRACAKNGIVELWHSHLLGGLWDRVLGLIRASVRESLSAHEVPGVAGLEAGAPLPMKLQVPHWAAWTQLPTAWN